MDNRLQTLLDKYWEGSTTILEEDELKALLKNSEEYPEEKAFFNDLGQMKTLLQPPKKAVKQIYHWQLFSKIAAGISLVLGGMFLFHYQKKQAEKEAYYELIHALEMVNENMRKGKNSMQSMEEFRHLKITKEILDLPN
jgi:hypothetical protein